jgi:alkylation response protein AidB-like acyl-CoA dehydrogenase
MDFSWSPEEQELRSQLRSYVADNLFPGWTQTDRDVPTKEKLDAAIRFCEGLAERGLLTPAWPVEYGGRAASLWEQVVISEELWGVGEPRGPQYMNANWIGPAILQLGSPEQKQEHLSAIAAGRANWAQGFSEPDAGSDLSALRTAAVRDGDFYVINGQKMWTSYAHAASHIFLLVRTSKQENPRRGISILLVPMDTAGIEVREIPALHFSHLVHEVFFRDVRVPVSCRLGPENEGWSIIHTLLANERVANARHEWVDRCLDRVFDEAVELGVDMDDEAFWETMGEASAAALASRVMNYVAVQAAADESSSYPDLASIYRVALAQMEMGAAHAFMDVLGSEALQTTSCGDYQLQAGILSTIGGGSIEMALNSIAWYQLGLPKG